MPEPEPIPGPLLRPGSEPEPMPSNPKTTVTARKCGGTNGTCNASRVFTGGFMVNKQKNPKNSHSSHPQTFKELEMVETQSSAGDAQEFGLRYAHKGNNDVTLA